MKEYIFSADLLNKYSQLTPWVQVLIGITFASTILGIAYFLKESIAVLMRPFVRDADEEKQKLKGFYFALLLSLLPLVG